MLSLRQGTDLDMDNELKNPESGINNDEVEKAKIARIKRMRGWLGVKSSGISGGHADSFEPLLPGEGHSGWNR